MSRTLWAWARPVGGAAILGLLLWRLGSGPFLHGLRSVHGWSLAAALAITAGTTVCSAWRWSLVARGLGVPVSLRRATAAYYRSQFLNTLLPGGVLGDVDRAVRHGRTAGNLGRGVRAVAWERSAGQAVQIGLALGVLLLFGLPAPWLAALLVGAIGLAAVLAAQARWTPATSRWAGALRVLGADIRDGVLAGRAWPGIALASVLVVAGHLGIFLVAAQAAGAAQSIHLLPLGMMALVAMAVPINVGGWGPREGVAAWSFAAAGLGAESGVATATTYGLLAFAATLPGAALVAGAWLRGRQERRRGPCPTAPTLC